MAQTPPPPPRVHTPPTPLYGPMFDSPTSAPSRKRVSLGPQAPSSPSPPVLPQVASNIARVLFHDLETDPEQIMPTPSKSRRSKKRAAFSLESFEEDRRNGNKVDIYTDSKERMPEVDDNDDNPFVVRKNQTKTSDGPAASTTHGRRRTRHGMNRETDKAVENNEGIVYTFRGKKIFRKFSDTNDTSGNDEDGTAALSGQETLRRQAGSEARKPLTRSSVKPRLLFPPKNEAAKAGHSMEAEEAKTDIESTTVESDGQLTLQEPHQSTEHCRSDGKQKQSPFDSWPRTKPGRHRAAKRVGEPMEKAIEKRSRSAHPAFQS